MLKKNILLMCVLFCSVGCVTSKSTTKNTTESEQSIQFVHIQELLPTDLFGDRTNVSIPDSNTIFALSETAKIEFWRYSNEEQNLAKRSYEKVYGFLQDFGWEFQYIDATKSSLETYALQSGNCMSLALLTTALAKHAGVPIHYQLVRRLPIFKEYGSVTFNAQHVRSVLTEPENETTLDAKDKIKSMKNANETNTSRVIRASAIVDYYPSRYSYVDGVVAENEFIAMYYRNLAAEELGQTNYQRSFWLAMESLKYEADSGDALNTLAILYRRLGEQGIANDIFTYAVDKYPNNTSVLRNYRVLLLNMGDKKRASWVDSKLSELGSQNPFGLIKQAERSFQQDNYLAAKTKYKQVIDMAPYLHQGYFGLAKTEYMLGNSRRSKNLLQYAYNQAYDDESKKIYKAKLMVLQ